MKTTILIIGILLATSSCGCFKIKDDVRIVWSFKFNQCRCQWYSFKKVKNKTKLVPCQDFYLKYFPELELKPNHLYCDDLVGFSKESWAKNITPHGRETMACIQDNKKLKKRKCK